ncbi:glycogen/starch/alpha-glucan phosphorylase [Psychromarinibacter sp. C21-152]|uniref:Alpha-1,4 glucan phosphorylase n=1 Tax=Psychromarinibacter sediminicola TaxID=3033385 RepID=A0AAE3NSS4_9RHOB|nr:glycogen/starch/alpha-glucan phosphorylase [Psychromarinibacter sediminicola]MDF0601351.1 glycogen/starch/alpha-glucan phosphorylase [Psychromarinibacter sediminicola]
MALDGITPQELRDAVLWHLTYTLGKDPGHASLYDWRMAMSFSLRDRIVEPWFDSTRLTYETGAKRVYYLSLEFLIGKMLNDAATNLGLRDVAERALEGLGPRFDELVADEPDAALGNGGLGRLAACFMESLATLGVPAHGYGIRYEHGLFRQRFEGGRQVETPEDWLKQKHPWEFERPEVAYEIGFKGSVHGDSWSPGESVMATAHDMPIVGWQGKWANTLRLWAAESTNLLDLDRFNAGDYTAAAEPEALARTISRVLYPDDTTYAGKELRLKQEYFMVSAALQDILRRYFVTQTDPRQLHKHVAIQLNDTHPAIAGPELIRLLMKRGLTFEEGAGVAERVLNYTNHTLLPEALERWSTWLMGNVLPQHMDLIERLDDRHRKAHPDRPKHVGIVQNNEVHMGNLAFIMANKVNGVSALHTDLVKETVFADLHALHPGRIVNQTNGVTPRRWLKLANPALATLITDTIGEGWEADLDRLQELEPHIGDNGFATAFGAAKRANKVALSNWIGETTGIATDPDAIFDIQIKRIHEYKRQLMNILQTVALWHRIRQDPDGDWVPRVKIFGGKSAPGYAVAKEIVHLINDVAAVINADPQVKGLLKVVYPPNYNVSMAERLIPAADLSEQISTAGKEASGTGNMKFALNGTPTIGTLDGANVEIRERVGAENFFLFGMTADEVVARRRIPDHARLAIEASQTLRDVLQIVAEGRFSPDDPDRYHGIVDRMWHHDYFLVASDFDAFDAAQSRVDSAWRDPAGWQRMAALNTARVGYFSSDRTIRGYMADIWDVTPAS